jgi:hypothetical protein
MKTTIFNNIKIIENISNISLPDPNNIPCTIINVNGNDHDNSKLECVQSIGNISDIENNSDFRTKLYTSNGVILNNTTMMDINGSFTFSPAIINKQSAIIIDDPLYISYTVIPSPDGVLPSDIPNQPKCNLVNTGTINNPILMCNESIGINKNVTILPPIVPEGCILENIGTQTNPLLKCQQILPPNNQEVLSESPVEGVGRTLTTGIKSLLNMDSITSGTQSAGALLSVQKSKNPYSTIISNLNQNTTWTCPAGYIAQYPNQGLTDCDAYNNCIDFYQNPAVLNQPCIGPSIANYKYNNEPYGALDMNSNIQCDYGFPIFSGVNRDGIFNGDVKCLYQNSSDNLV